MKPTKMRNRQIYRATHRTRSNQLGSALSKDLQKKYGKRSIRVVEGDSVKVIRGEYKDVDGKVSKVSTAASSIAIEGIKKEKGQGDKFDVLIHASNVIVTSLNTDDSWRISKLEGKQVKSAKKISKTDEPTSKTSEIKSKKGDKPTKPSNVEGKKEEKDE